MQLSVIIPIYNEEKTIKSSLLTLYNYLISSFKTFEIIAVNDGSTDNTLKILKTINFIRLISYEKNKGKGYAVKRGILLAKGEFLFFTDADLSFPPENILRGIFLLNSDKSEYVVGTRKNKKETYPLVRRILSKGFSNAVHFLLKLDINDTQCGFKGFRRTIAKNIFPRVQDTGFCFDIELLFLLKTENLKSSTLPVTFSHKDTSHIRIFRDSLNMFFSLLKIKFRSKKFERHKL